MECISVDQFKVLVKAMKAVYAQPTFIPDEDAFKVWYSLLRDIDYQVLQSAIQKYMMSKTFPPTIADIRAEAASFRVKAYGEPMGELEAWALVRKAVGNSGYHNEEEFLKLPPLVQKAVGNPANLKEWALTDTDTVDSVIQSHFVRNYRAAVQRANDDAKLSPVLLQRIEEYAQLSRIGSNDGALLEPKEKEPEQKTASPEYIDELLKKFREKH